MLTFHETPYGASLHGLGAATYAAPSGNSASDIITSIATSAGDLFATFTGQKAAQQAAMTQLQIVQLQAQTVQETASAHTRDYLIFGGVAVAALFALIILKR